MKGGLRRVAVLIIGILLISGCGDVLWHRDKDDGKKSMTDTAPHR